MINIKITPLAASAIGIIGGADGPTAFYTTVMIKPAIVAGGLCSVALVALGLWFFLKCK